MVARAAAEHVLSSAPPCHANATWRPGARGYAHAMAYVFVPEAPVAALVLRAVVVYEFLLVALRVAGRRELAQMTSFDLVLLLVIFFRGPELHQRWRQLSHGWDHQ